MSEKNYIIAMEKGQSKDLLKDELTAETGNDYVPARSVDIEMLVLEVNAISIWP